MKENRSGQAPTTATGARLSLVILLRPLQYYSAKTTPIRPVPPQKYGDRHPAAGKTHKSDDTLIAGAAAFRAACCLTRLFYSPRAFSTISVNRTPSS